MSDVTLITPTRDRAEALMLCALWLSRQTFRGLVQWIIVDDGDTPVDIDLIQRIRGESPNQEYTIEYIRQPLSPPEVCTLQSNMLAALNKVDGRIVLVIEDDEYYAPIYVEEMHWRMKDLDLTGERMARYYNVAERRWALMMDNDKHASLCRTGFSDSLIPHIKELTLRCQEKKDPFIDMKIWGARKSPPPAAAQAIPAPAPEPEPMANRPWAVGASWGKPAAKTTPAATPLTAISTPTPNDPDPFFLPYDTRAGLFEGRGISIGIKGMAGRAGVGKAHGSKAFKNVDPNWAKLIEWIGPDARYYIELAAKYGWGPVL